MTAPRPVRLQLSRRKGFELQALSLAINGLPAVKADRTTRWGNPFTAEGCRGAGYVGTNEQIAKRCVNAFEAWLTHRLWQMNWDGPEAEIARSAILTGLPALRGKNLACWCKPGDPCHADVLLELANAPICEEVS
jgi:hypothetical protein